MTYTFASMFSGGGLADVGMMQAGWVPLWGIEHDPAIAAVYMQNVHACCMVADVCKVDYAALDRPDHLHASPVCKNASVANSDGKESEQDMEMAQAVCRAIRALLPSTFSLENVFGYRKFRAYQSILRTLCESGYEFEQHHCNSADYGVPQTRMRLILRASRIARLRPLEPTHSARTEAQGMFAAYEPLPPWIGWYAAIQDLIPTLPESRFADWQLMRLPSELTGDFLHMTSNTQKANPTGTGVLARPAPANTVTSGDGARPRAFLADCVHRTDADLTARTCDEPAHTIKSSDFRRPCNVPKAFLMPLNGENSGPTVQAAPAPTVTANHSAEKVRAFLVDGHSEYGENATLCLREQSDPARTVRASIDKDLPRAFLVSDQSGNDGEECGLRPADTPASTVRSLSGGGAVPRAFVVHPNDMRTMPTREAQEPMFTVMAIGNPKQRSNAGFKPRALPQAEAATGSLFPAAGSEGRTA